MIVGVAIALAVIAVVVLAVVIARRTRQPDGVATFRRQIDALSPEARRTVVDEVQRLEDRAADGIDDEDPR